MAADWSGTRLRTKTTGSHEDGEKFKMRGGGSKSGSGHSKAAAEEATSGSTEGPYKYK